MAPEDIAALVRGRYERFSTSGELNPGEYDPDFAFDMSTFKGWPEKKRYEGLEGFKEFLSDWTEVWEDWRLEPEEIVPADENRVVVITRQYGRSKATGIDAEMRFSQVWTLGDDGRYLRSEMYATPEEGLAAAGC
jgi:ketosteroid isomerase-like protein